MSSRTLRVEPPILQPLGFQGEEYFLKIVFPINELEEEDVNDMHVPTIKGPVGKRAVILKFKIEDLPMHSLTGAILHFDVGQAIRDRFGETQ